jgi:ubiquitin C-terminal hydrolase|tara:strand:- start:3345 stop:4373 length:1029 start_codon:yes stop_codon:yes gene_type:complete
MTSKYEGGLSGLVNLGNTCYMNSAIQCLSHTQPLTNYFLNKQFVNDYNQKSKTCNLAKEWYRLVDGLHEDNCVVSPKSFYRTIVHQSEEMGISFGFGNQNDVQEFLVFFIDSLHEALCKEVVITISGTIKNETDKMALKAMTNWKEFFKNSYSKIIQLFYGQMVTRIFVNGIVKSTNYSPICFFTLYIPENKANPTIYDCFDNFTGIEKMTGDNKWKDDNGITHDAEKKIDIWDFPEVIIVSINRFNNRGQKRNDMVQYPIVNLDLSKYCIGYNKYKSKYNLYGICNHTGGSNSGHYFSYCKLKDGHWYEFNDSSVSKISNDKLVTSSAYCLFYKKMGLINK